jgi:hypothetical protein
VSTVRRQVEAQADAVVAFVRDNPDDPAVGPVARGDRRVEEGATPNTTR